MPKPLEHPDYSDPLGVFQALMRGEFVQIASAKDPDTGTFMAAIIQGNKVCVFAGLGEFLDAESAVQAMKSWAELHRPDSVCTIQ